MKLGKWDISVKVGCSPEMEKIERATLIQRSNDSFMHWARLQNNNGNVSVSVATVLRGWIGQELPDSQSKIALHLCSENRGCDELLVQHRRFTSEGFLFHEHPGCIFSAANGHKEGHKSALPQKILCWFIPSKVRKSASFYNGFWNDSVKREMWAGM